MSDLFFNKIAAAALCSVIGFIGINKFANAVVHPKPAAGVAYSLASNEPTTVVAAVEAPFPSAVWISARDADKGAKVFKKCKSCHTIDNGGRDGTGPNLFDIVGKAKAGNPSFSYSAGMKAKGGDWGYEELDEFLEKPKAYITKTKMGFNGLKKEEDRAALIEYLRLASDTPMDALMVAAPIPGAEMAEEMVVEMVGEVPVEMPADTPAVEDDHTHEETPVPGGH